MLESEKKFNDWRKREREWEETLCESFCNIILDWCVQHSGIIGRWYSCCCHRLNGWCVSLFKWVFLFFVSCYLPLTRFHLSFCYFDTAAAAAVAAVLLPCVCVWFLHKRQEPWSPSMKRALTLRFLCVRLRMRVQNGKIVVVLFSSLVFFASSHHHCSACIQPIVVSLCIANCIGSHRMFLLLLDVMNFLSILLHLIWDYTIKTVAINSNEHYKFELCMRQRHKSANAYVR